MPKQAFLLFFSYRKVAFHHFWGEDNSFAPTNKFANLIVGADMIHPNRGRTENKDEGRSFHSYFLLLHSKKTQTHGDSYVCVEIFTLRIP